MTRRETEVTICDIETLGLGEWHHYTSAHTKTAAGTLVGGGRDSDLKIIGIASEML